MTLKWKLKQPLLSLPKNNSSKPLFKKLTQGCDFSQPTLAINDVVLNEFDPRFYKDDNKLR